MILLGACGGAASRAPESPRQDARATQAKRTFLELRKAAGDALARRSWPELRAALVDLLPFGAHPDVLYALAVVEVKLGRPDSAIGWLRKYAALGLARDGIEADEDLAPARAAAGWDDVVRAMQENVRPISTASLAVRLPDEELLAEDLAYDAATRTFFVSAVRAREILALREEDGTTAPFARPGQDGLWSVLGLGVDGARRRLWAATAAMPQANLYRSEDAGKSAVHLYDLASKKLLRHIELSSSPGAPHALTDLTVAPSGDAYVSDALGGRVYLARAAGGALEPLDDGATFRSPQTPALAIGARALFVPDYSHGIAKIDLASRAVTWLAQPETVTTVGIDGLYALDARTLLAVQNGTTPARVVRLVLDDAATRVERLEVLEQNSVFLGAPTHGVIVGDDFFFIGRSGWEHMNDDGSVKLGESPRGSVVLRLHLR